MMGRGEIQKLLPERHRSFHLAPPERSESLLQSYSGAGLQCGKKRCPPLVPSPILRIAPSGWAA
jgi:hypothetical protein